MIYYDVIPPTDLLVDFDEIKREITFHHVTNQSHEIPRMIAIQGTIDDRTTDQALKPIYRHPMDFQPDVVKWTSSTLAVRNHLSRKFNQDLNHCLIQLYRSGHDSIGEHADKTLDIKMGTNIINYSIGASRTMHLRLKNRGEGFDRKLTKIPLTHNSAFVLDWHTNKQYLHGIRPDKRPEHEKAPDEKAYNGEHISFTFRTIDTFIDSNNMLHGQGAKRTETMLESKSSMQQSDERTLIIQESMSLLKAFSDENNRSDLEWHEIYGNGYQIVNFRLLNTGVNDLEAGNSMDEQKSIGES